MRKSPKNPGHGKNQTSNFSRAKHHACTRKSYIPSTTNPLARRGKMKKTQAILYTSIITLILILTATSTKAYIPGPGTQVALVPYADSGNGGTLPTTDPAFSDFTFTDLPWSNVTAGNLTAYQIVVLMIEPNSAPYPLVSPGASTLSPQQLTDLNNWVYNGGKLIIHDSEMAAVNYSWLPYHFTTNNPGAGGYTGQPITYMESDFLGNNTPSSPNFINITQADVNIWEDAVGDSNVFVSQDAHWCGHIEATNGNGVRGWVHTYATYGNGTMIYNGFDQDYLSSSTTPGTVGIANTAKLFLLELKMPWGTDYDMPCSRKATAVGGEIINTPTLLNYLTIAIAATAVITTVTLLFKKLLNTRLPKPGT
jgi:hypothetical protein